MNRVPFGKAFIAGKELYYIAETVFQAHLSGNGPFTQRCQSWLQARLDVPRALLTHSCTAALEMAAMLCDVQPGDEVIMPSFTFVSTANAFVLRGAVPVFVDIRRDTLNIDEQLIEAAITHKTRAIVPVHYAGTACDMDAIMALARRHDLLVVEDAAQALFSEHKGRALGSIGHFGCLSFHETKNIISGEGGALLINDPRFFERAEILWEKGTNRSQMFRGEVDKYTWMDVGSSFLPSELVSAFLYAQLEQAEQITAKRRWIFRQYCELLAPLRERGLVEMPCDRRDMPYNGHIFYLMTRSLEERSALIAHLRQAGVYAVFHYVPLHSSPAGQRYGRVSGDMQVTDQVSDRLLRLPLYYEMGQMELDQVVDSIKSFYKLI